MSEFKNDPWWGKGGRYVVDPQTGQRMPAAPAGEDIPGVVVETAAEPGPGEQLPGSTLPPVKEKRRV